MNIYFKVLSTKRGILLFISVVVFSIGLVSSFFVNGECNCDDTNASIEGECSLRGNNCLCVYKFVIRKITPFGLSSETVRTVKDGECNYMLPIIMVCAVSLVLLSSVAYFLLENQFLKVSQKVVIPANT